MACKQALSPDPASSAMAAVAERAESLRSFERNDNHRESGQLDREALCSGDPSTIDRANIDLGG